MNEHMSLAILAIVSLRCTDLCSARRTYPLEIAIGVFWELRHKFLKEILGDHTEYVVIICSLRFFSPLHITLANEQEIAVKGLSTRNLVRLMEFCLEGEETLLDYEYVPNKS
ncbi:hypothetical protein DVH24_016066 [Malus domestica]|uniref:Uncharacterized protein n=1 Tax=Malus domestica TaxID=3750 RepID=A0A498JDR5_MALDO|nr:hypothetical protein DVH24_016066 [Malus domestica]